MISQDDNAIDFLIKSKHLPISELKNLLKKQQLAIRQDILALNPAVVVPAQQDVTEIRDHFKDILAKVNTVRNHDIDKMIVVKENYDLLKRMSNTKPGTNLKRKVVEYAICPQSHLLAGILSQLDALLTVSPTAETAGLYLLIDQEPQLRSTFHAMTEKRISSISFVELSEFFIQITDYTKHITSDILISVYLEVALEVLMKKSSIFGFGATFEPNYTCSLNFLNGFHTFSVSNRDVFLKKWQLQVYHQLKSNELLQELKSSMAVGAKANNVEFSFLPSETLVRCTSTCWDASIVIKAVAHLFWQTTLDLIESYLEWSVKQVLNVGQQTDTLFALYKDLNLVISSVIFFNSVG